MSMVAALTLLLAGSSTPQLAVPEAVPLPASPLYRAPPAISEAAAPYVTAGQDEPGYRAWYNASKAHPVYVKAFNDYLAAYDVAGIVPTWQLLRTASMWKACGEQPFEVPPPEEWPHVVQTLRYLKDYVIPTVGPVEPVSAYRNPALNVCAGGARESAHQHFQAVDLVPLQPFSRQQLMARLCSIQRREGAPYEVGLGFYAYLRFHIDTARFRKWGAAASNEAASCATPLPQPALAKAAPAQPLLQASAVTAAPSAAAAAIVVAAPALAPAIDPLAPLPALDR